MAPILTGLGMAGLTGALTGAGSGAGVSTALAQQDQMLQNIDTMNALMSKAEAVERTKIQRNTSAIAAQGAAVDHSIESLNKKISDSGRI